MEGLLTIQSNIGPKETMDRPETEIKAHGRPFLCGLITPHWRSRWDWHCAPPRSSFSAIIRDRLLECLVLWPAGARKAEFKME